MKDTIKLTPELYNLLTLPLDDQVDDFTREDIIQMIEAAYESIKNQ